MMMVITAREDGGKLAMETNTWTFSREKSVWGAPYTQNSSPLQPAAPRRWSWAPDELTESYLKRLVGATGQLPAADKLTSKHDFPR